MEKTIATVDSKTNLDDILGRTLEERAKLVLLTLGETPEEIQKAYRRLAKQHHPDKTNGNTEKFQVINEAYEFLIKDTIPKRPLLAEDELVIKVAGKRVQPLIDIQKKWEEYETWRRDRFYGIGVI